MQNAEEVSSDEAADLIAHVTIAEHAPQQHPPAEEASEAPALADVLILGEGNGTFALSSSLAGILKEYGLIDRFRLHVTDNISLRQWEAAHPGNRARLLEKGYFVQFEVDAANTDLVQGKTLIIFNFPFVHAIENGSNVGEQKTVKLIKDTLLNIVRKADCGTRVWIALATAKRRANATKPYGVTVKDIIKDCIAASRDIEDCDHCLLFEDALDSLLQGVRGYKHVLTHSRQPKDGIWFYQKMVVYCFKVVRTPDAIFRMLQRDEA